jgi:hypothetical protein
MPLHASSYFAGVATVVATMTLGFGGGILMTDAFVGKSDNPPTLTERRASPLMESTAPVVTAGSNSETAPSPAAQTANPVVAAAPNSAPPAANAAVAVPQPQPVTAGAPSPAASSAAQPVAAAPQAAPVTASAPAVAQTLPPQNDDAMAKARDDDVKKALTAERRKAERRKWAERRKQELRKIDELHAIAERVKDAERERQPSVPSFVAQSPGILIGDD